MLIEIIDSIGILNFFIVIGIIGAATVIGISWLVFFVSRAWHKGKQSAEK